MRINANIFSLFLFISFIVVIMPAIPHHHHTDGVVCMDGDVKDDPWCAGDCLGQKVDAEPALQGADPVQPQFLYSIMLFSEPLLRFITQHEERAVRYDGVYLESLHGTCIARAAGLRAPPFFFSV
jgi:hypothetical protein